MMKIYLPNDLFKAFPGLRLRKLGEINLAWLNCYTSDMQIKLNSMNMPSKLKSISIITCLNSSENEKFLDVR